jgi:hypothetical protein
MPPAPVDPGRLRALGSALARWQECAGAGADEVLGHLVEVGDADTQSALDDYLDVVADLLRRIEAGTSETAERLRAAAASATTPSEPARTRPAAPTPLPDTRRALR